MTTWKNLKIGISQLLVEGAEPKRNLRRTETTVKDPASQVCDIIVLPECLDLG
jgi:predicted amidohydrolase